MRYLLFALLILAAVPAWSQDTGIIEGVVRTETGDILPGANVVVQGTTLGAATDTAGRYRIEDVPRGPLSLVVSYVGFMSITIDAVLETDTLAINAILDSSCAQFMCEVMVFYPHGVVFTHSSWEEPVDPPGAEPASARVSLSSPFNRASDQFGRWHARGPSGLPTPYVRGSRALSFDDVPVGEAGLFNAYAGYVPARYAATTSGTVSTDIGRESSCTVYAAPPRRAWVGSTSEQIAGEVQGSARAVVLSRGTCEEIVRDVETWVEGRASTTAAVPMLDGRLGVGYSDRDAHITAMARGGIVETDALGDSRQASGSLRWQPTDFEGDSDLSLFFGTLRQSDDRSANIISARLERGLSYNSRRLGLEGFRITRQVDTARRAESSVAVFLDETVDLDGYEYRPSRLFRDPRATLGLRIERIGVETDSLSRSAWTLQPRVLVETELSHSGSAFAYLVGTASPGHGMETDIQHRLESGAGVQIRSWYPLVLGVAGWARHLTGSGPSANVFGSEVTGTLDWWKRGLGRLQASARFRHEWDAAELARNRFRLDATAYNTSGAHPLVDRLGVYADISEGVASPDGSRPPITWLGVTLGSAVLRDLTLHIEGVLSGSNAVPCVDIVGFEDLAEQACPAPDARLLVGMTF